MVKRFGLAPVVLLLAGVLALGTVAAFARGPVGDGVHGVVSTFNLDEDDDGDAADQEDQDEDEDADENGDLDEDDDVDEDEDADENGDLDEDDGDADEDNDDADVAAEGEEGEEKIAAALVDEFGGSEAELMDLHDQGIGWGALFQLLAIATARGITLDALLAEIGFPDEHDSAFGQMREELSQAELETLADGPKNLGELVSEASKGEPEGEAAGLGHGHGKGKPKGVPPEGQD